MPAITLGYSNYERTEGNLPPLLNFNYYAEKTDSEDVVLQSRRGLDDLNLDMGDGPVRQLFRRDLVVGSTLYGVSGSGLYSGTTLIGSISGSGFVSMAGNEIGLMVTAGNTLYFYDGSTLSTVSFPDGANVAHVETGGARYWLVRKDTGKLYYTDALESDVGALDFLTAESLPDRLLQTIWLKSMLVALGSESIEYFQQTGNADLPLTPLTNMVVEQGIRETGAACRVGETFAAVTNRNTVIMGSDAQIVSNPGLQAKIEASSSVRLFAFLLDGNEMLCLRLDDETHVYTPAGTWHEWGTYGQTNWAAQCYAANAFGSAYDGKILDWGGDYTEAPATDGILERLCSAGFALNGGSLQISNVMARVNAGQTTQLTGDYAEPRMEMRVSRNAGQTWGKWKAQSLGRQGEYGKKVQWRGGGQASYPGFLAQFRCTDPVPLRVSSILINEPFGGR